MWQDTAKETEMFSQIADDWETKFGLEKSINQKVMLRLHYVPGGHGSQDFGHRGRNGVTVTQRRGTGLTNVARRGCRDRRDRF